MTKKIIKFNKAINFIDENDIEVSEGMTIDHYSDTVTEGSGEIPFKISSSNCQEVGLKDLDFCVVVREKVNLNAIGPNEEQIKSGEYKSAIDLPKGFVELKKAEK
jgi:hypothetical protein